MTIPEFKTFLIPIYKEWYIKEEDMKEGDEYWDEEMKELEEDFAKDDFHKVIYLDCLKKDLEKLDDFFGAENSFTEPNDGWLQDVPSGFITLENGLTCLICHAGNDYQQPIAFVVYPDGNKLRAYIPKKGNPWNWKTKELFSGNEDDDFEQMSKQILDPELLSEFKTKYETNQFEIEHDRKYLVSWEAMKQDILERIKIR